MKLLKWRTRETKIFKVFETYCIKTYNITVFDIDLSSFCFYFITSLFPDSVLCLLQKPALDLCCVVGLPPPLPIRIMTTSGNFRDFVTPRVDSWLSLYFAGYIACSSHAFVLQLEPDSFSLWAHPAFLWGQWVVIHDSWPPAYEEST